MVYKRKESGTRKDEDDEKALAGGWSIVKEPFASGQGYDRGRTGVLARGLA
jgi:hypothetical protein